MMVDMMQLLRNAKQPDDKKLRFIDPSALDRELSGLINVGVTPQEEYIDILYYSIGYREYTILRIYEPDKIGIIRWRADEEEKND